MADYVELPLPAAETGIAVEKLTVPKARDFARVIDSSSAADIVDCVKITYGGSPFFRLGDEIVIFDINLEVSQRPVNDIRYVERIAVHFDATDRNTPWVYALRSDFPQVLHRNALYFKEPQCLCIYENTYDEMKAEWRSIKFLTDIRHWLELTADDKLHQDDQPLEAFLVSNLGTIIIPPDYKAGDTLHIYPVARKGGRLSLTASRIELKNREPYAAHLIELKGLPQPHGVMGWTPNNLADLHRLLEPSGIDLMQRIKQEVQGLPKSAKGLERRLMFLLELPKTGAGEGVNENDYYVFLSAESAEEIGLQLGIFEKSPEHGGIGNVLFETPDFSKGKVLGVGALLPQVQLTPDWALLLSGNFEEQDKRETKIFQIGTGALGSQFFMNQARGGFGRWTLTDHDFLMPHNLVRHAADMTYMGNFKSFGLAVTANQLFGGNEIATALNEDYLYPERPEEFAQHLAAAQVIVDASTSIAVARHLADRTDVTGRRISIFLSPAGSDLVILAEDKDRQQTLDILEYQYYQQLASNAALGDHLNSQQGIRISASCRDITARIAQDNVAILAGIASHEFRKIIRAEEPFTGIWRIDEATMAVTPYSFETLAGDIWKVENWTISVGRSLIDKISAARFERMPNETGGILIGGYDLERKKIYLTDTILSPPDSEEYPTAYIRGTEGVEYKLDEYRVKTADHLKYAGEWHSHPVGCSLDASSDDKVLFQHIQKEMQAIGFPPLMIIAGDDDKYKIYFQP